MGRRRLLPPTIFERKWCEKQGYASSPKSYLAIAVSASLLSIYFIAFMWERLPCLATKPAMCAVSAKNSGGVLLCRRLSCNPFLYLASVFSSAKSSVSVEIDPPILFMSLCLHHLELELPPGPCVRSYDPHQSEKLQYNLICMVIPYGSTFTLQGYRISGTKSALDVENVGIALTKGTRNCVRFVTMPLYIFLLC